MENLLKPNFLQLPNVLVDDLMKLLTPVEFLCLVVILRKTRGWDKDDDAISLSQFQHLTGIRSKKTIIRALDRLTDKNVGLISVKKRPRVTTIYELGPLFYGKKCTREAMVKIEQALVYKSNKITPFASVKNTHTKELINKKERENGRQAAEVKKNKENGRQAAEVGALARDCQKMLDRGRTVDLEPDDNETPAEFEKRLIALEYLGGVYAKLQG
jgi:hypothetical protein